MPLRAHTPIVTLLLALELQRASQVRRELGPEVAQVIGHEVLLTHLLRINGGLRTGRLL